MKIETRYQPDKSAEQKGEGIMESSWGNTTEYSQWILTLKMIAFSCRVSNTSKRGWFILSEEEKDLWGKY